MKEIDAWVERGVTENIWSAAYALIKSFRGNPASPDGSDFAVIDSAPVISVEAHRVSQEEQDKYYRWFNDSAGNLFMPLLLKMPGLAGYDWYQDTGRRRRQDTRETEYPPYLSIIYFENIKAYENYAESPELAAVNKSMRSVFPRGLNFQWLVQYQLVKSWSK
jgi:hypothetical protein